MKLGALFGLVVFCCANLLLAEEQAWTERCEQWDDFATNARFPKEIAGMRMQARSASGENGCSLFYVTPGWEEDLPDQRKLMIILLPKQAEKLEADEVAAATRKDLEATVAMVAMRQEDGEEQDVSHFKLARSAVAGRLDRAGLDYVQSLYSYRTEPSGERMLGAIMVTACQGSLLKAWYSSPAGDGAGAEPARWTEVLSVLDDLLKDGQERRAADVYALADPAEALKVLQKKWAGAGGRIPQWQMPGHQQEFDDMNAYQDWCNDDPANRYALFELVSKRAIDLQIEPAIWYYNLACAHAVLGRKNEAVATLEQAVSAGYNRHEHASKDSDLSSLADDARFAKLLEMMKADRRRSWDDPTPVSVGRDGCVRLKEENVHYAFKYKLFSANLCTTNDCPVLYVNHHDNHPDIPCDGIIPVAFPQEAEAAGVTKGLANMYFVAADSNDVARQCCPTIVASDCRASEDGLTDPTSLTAGLMTLPEGVRDFLGQAIRNVVGIYSAADDYGADGVDRFLGYSPLMITHDGGAEAADKFVKLSTELIHALPADARKYSSFVVPYLIRRAQRGINTAADFMSGRAHRPVIDFKDIDVERALALAKTMKDESGVRLPMFDLGKCDLDTNTTPVSDLWETPYDRLWISGSAANLCLVARPAESTVRIRVTINRLGNEQLEWHVLQGDPKKVRIVPVADADAVDIEVDWHVAFEVERLDGTKVRSSRVDIGCFDVKGGEPTLPSVVSVYFPPNETRTYGQDGKLVSIDYTRPQYPTFRPRICGNGCWKDEFHWSEDGKLTGWSRLQEDSKGNVSTNEYTWQGLVIDTRDELGRPKDVHRNLFSTWYQECSPTNRNEEDIRNWMVWCGRRFDDENAHPCAPSGGTELAWQYAYTNDTDRFGLAQPKVPKPYSYRPELCRRAQFDDASGFRLPLPYQVEIGYERHAAYKHNVPGQQVSDLMREDSAIALKAYGLCPPKELRRMRFCPFVARTNDVWKVNLSDVESEYSASLAEMGSGVYRFREPSQSEGAVDGYDYLSVGETGWKVHRTVDCVAYDRLDEHYRRCGADEIRKLVAKWCDDDRWTSTLVVDRGYVKHSQIPEDKTCAISAWEVSPGIYYCICNDKRRQSQPSSHCFITYDSESGDTKKKCFNAVPTKAIGNTYLRSENQEAEALNNLAVLHYAEIAEPGSYDEETVLMLLEDAARQGCATAKYNLGVLNYNKGNARVAERYFEEAKSMERASLSK